jgi:hypothetical protein
MRAHWFPPRPRKNFALLKAILDRVHSLFHAVAKLENRPTFGADEILARNRSQNLAPVGNAYPNKTQVKPLAEKILAGLASSQGGGQIDGTLTLGEFVETRYFPHIDQRIQMSGEFHPEPSTLKCYRDIWKFLGKGKPIDTIGVRDFHTAHAQGFLVGLDRSPPHQTQPRIKAFLSGVFGRRSR